MVAVEMAEDSGELDWERVLHGGSPPPHRFAEEEIASSGSGRGPLVGGCLSLVASLAGTPDAVRGSGTVFFWEDVGEELYRLDRMLTQLERSGTFDGLQAMVIGSVAPGARGGRESADAVRRWLRLRFAGAPFPVAFGLPAGHVRRPRTLPLGATVALDAERGVLEFETAAVV
jgi:muramoyltetrapeptide carboxypeptidase